MKLISYKITALAIATFLMIAAWSCQEPETATPAPVTTSSGLTANFLFINASPDAPSLDLYVNNLKVGESETFSNAFQNAYVTAPVTTNGVGANTNVRLKGTSGDIGGILGNNDVMFRAGNNNANNMSASSGARYTFIAMDTIKRPSPLRTLNSGNFGDTTYYNTVTGAQMSVVERAALLPVDKAKLVPVGTVPLGSSDPGGIRFLLLTDFFPAFPAGNQTQAGIRFVHASPNSTNLWVRLKPSAGSNVTVASNVPYALSFSAFTGTSTTPGGVPSVGSRSLAAAASGTPNAANFTLSTIAISGTPTIYTLEISTNSGFTNIVVTIPNVTFSYGKFYTIVAYGLAGKTDNRKLGATIVPHN